MPLKKKKFAAGEIAIFDDAVIYKRGEYWQFRMWLSGEGKYARKSLRTRSQATAEERGKDAYFEIRSNAKAGKTYFSISTKEGVAKYIDERQKDVITGVIVAGRLQTITTHLKHWLDFIGKDTKLKELERTDCEDYYRFRYDETHGRIGRTTVLNEQSTINACISWLYKQGETPIDHFDFRKLPKIDRNNDEIRRATLTNDEYNELVRAMRSYVKKSQKGVDKEELLIRQIIRHWVLIAANSGLRVGEQRQLRWSDVKLVNHRNGAETVRLADIRVRAETSKVRTSRSLMCRGGQYFDRLWDMTAAHDEYVDRYIFSVDGEEPISKRTLYLHFKRLLDLADVMDWKRRKVVPYSLRHFMITQRIMSGLSFRQISDMCGTSVAQIERTYYHVNDEIRLTNAVADYRRKEDGTIEVI